MTALLRRRGHQKNVLVPFSGLSFNEFNGKDFGFKFADIHVVSLGPFNFSDVIKHLPYSQFSTLCSFIQ